MLVMKIIVEIPVNFIAHMSCNVGYVAYFGSDGTKFTPQLA
jgi:hypothetical protein